MTKIQNLSMISEINMTSMLCPYVLVIEYWNLDIICYLALEICDLIFCSELSISVTISENSKERLGSLTNQK